MTRYLLLLFLGSLLWIAVVSVITLMWVTP